jgi:hypothetical protein
VDNLLGKRNLDTVLTQRLFDGKVDISAEPPPKVGRHLRPHAQSDVQRVVAKTLEENRHFGRLQRASRREA